MLSVCLSLLRKAWSAAFCEYCRRKLVVCRFSVREVLAGAVEFAASFAAKDLSASNGWSAFAPAAIRPSVTCPVGEGVVVVPADFINASASFASSAAREAAALLSAKVGVAGPAAAAPCSNTFSGARASFAGAIDCCMASFMVLSPADWCSRHHQIADALTRTRAKAVAVMSRGHEIPDVRQRDRHSSLRAKRAIS